MPNYRKDKDGALTYLGARLELGLQGGQSQWLILKLLAEEPSDLVLLGVALLGERNVSSGTVGHH